MNQLRGLASFCCVYIIDAVGGFFFQSENVNTLRKFNEFNNSGQMKKINKNRRKLEQPITYDLYNPNPHCMNLGDDKYCANYKSKKFDGWTERSLIGYTNMARIDALGFQSKYNAIAYGCNYTKSNLEPLYWSSSYSESSRFHSWEMAQEDFFSHNTR